LYHIPPDTPPGVEIEQLQKYDARLLSQLEPVEDQPLEMTNDEHNSTVKALIGFVEPSREELSVRVWVWVPGSTERVCGYAESIIQFSRASPWEKVNKSNLPCTNSQILTREDSSKARAVREAPNSCDDCCNLRR
jgi:hypothetical protein